MSLWKRIYFEKRKVVLPLAVFLLANVGVLAFAVVPLQRSVANAKDRLTDSATALVVAQRQLTSAKEQRASKERADSELKTFYEQVLPTTFGQAVDMSNAWVERIGRESGVQLKSAQYDTAQLLSKDSRLVQMTGRVVLDGDYAAIRRFLFAMESARNFVVIEKVELSQSSESQQTTTAANMGSRIEVALGVSTYYATATRQSAVSK